MPRAPIKPEPTNSAIARAAPQRIACQGCPLRPRATGTWSVSDRERWGKPNGMAGILAAWRDQKLLDRRRERLRPGQRDREYIYCDKTPSRRGFCEPQLHGLRGPNAIEKCIWVLQLINQCARGPTRGCGLRRYMECMEVRERLRIRGVIGGH